MGNRMNLSQMQEIEEQLQKQISQLRILVEETRQAEAKIKEMSYMDRSRQALIGTREALEENIRVLTAMASVVREALLHYCQTEEKITDRYNLDTVEYPETQFGVSYITGLNDYQLLMPF